MNKRTHRRWARHRIRQPDKKWYLRGLTYRPDKEKKGSEVKPHLKTDNFTRQFDGGENKSHRKANCQSNAHLLDYRTKSLGPRDADDWLPLQTGL